MVTAPNETQRDAIERDLNEGRIDSMIIAERCGLRDHSLVHAVLEARIASVTRAYADRFQMVLTPARRVATRTGYRGQVVDLLLDALIVYESAAGKMPYPVPETEAAE